jgi:hypothetical protein
MAMTSSTQQEMLYAGPATAGVEERIRIWERLHGLRLPSTSAHALVRVVATQTHLSVGEVQAEQRRRSAGPAQPEASATEAAVSTI